MTAHPNWRVGPQDPRRAVPGRSAAALFTRARRARRSRGGRIGSRACLALLLAAVAVGDAHAAATPTRCASLFDPVSASPFLRDPESLATGDFTGDGRVDLAFSRIVSFGANAVARIGVRPA